MFKNKYVATYLFTCSILLLLWLAYIVINGPLIHLIWLAVFAILFYLVPYIPSYVDRKLGKRDYNSTKKAD